MNQIKRAGTRMGLFMLRGGMIIGYLINWLISSIFGILVLSIAVYLLVGRMSLTDPFNFPDLVDWFSRLSDSYRLALSSSLLTIVGFLIAFQTATTNWKNQMAASVALAAATDIQSFFSEGTRKLTSAKIFAELLLNSANTVPTMTSQDEINFQIDYVFSELPKFLAIRERLSEMSIEVHDLRGRYAQSLVRHWGALSKLDIAAEGLSSAANNIWFTVPVVKSDELGASDRFLRGIDKEECERFVQAYDEEIDKLSTLSGSISGSLQNPIFQFNFSTLYNFLVMAPDMPKIFRTLKAKNKAVSSRPGGAPETIPADVEESGPSTNQ